MVSKLPITAVSFEIDDFISPFILKAFKDKGWEQHEPIQTVNTFREFFLIPQLLMR